MVLPFGLNGNLSNDKNTLKHKKGVSIIERFRCTIYYGGRLQICIQDNLRGDHIASLFPLGYRQPPLSHHRLGLLRRVPFVNIADG
jgi:hypothetical protein